MPFELIVALRYLREGRTQTALILAGIAVGVGVIVFLSALIGGLQRTLIASTLGTQPHIVVRPREEVPRVLGPRDDTVREAQVERPAQRVRSIVQWQQARNAIASVPGVVATSPTISGAAIAVRGGGANAVALRGIEPETYRRIVPLDSFLVAGRVDLDGLKVLIGVDLARELGVEVGGRVRLRVGAEDRRGASDTASARAAYTVSGIFDFGNADLNERWVFASLRTTQSLFGLEGGASGIEVRVREIYAADGIAAEVVRRTGLVADSWMTTNAQLLRGLRSQSASSLMIQVFVVLAVALGIASVLAVSVVQKAREIGILRATGTSTRQVLRIFLAQGAILGGIGSAIGIAIGIGLGTFFASLATNPDGSPTFPVDLDVVLYLRSAAIAIGVGTLSALLPARRAALMNPADAIRTG
ncbi:MAG TPA: FtsX-like permease family protein [Gemmatimonadaceae bacterium]|nr:FtsX-like permease family protein [Gemmatimonadaceae bacterium]